MNISKFYMVFLATDCIFLTFQMAFESGRQKLVPLLWRSGCWALRCWVEFSTCWLCLRSSECTFSLPQSHPHGKPSSCFHLFPWDLTVPSLCVLSVTSVSEQLAFLCISSILKCGCPHRDGILGDGITVWWFCVMPAFYREDWKLLSVSSFQEVEAQDLGMAWLWLLSSSFSPQWPNYLLQSLYPSLSVRFRAWAPLMWGVKSYILNQLLFWELTW